MNQTIRAHLTTALLHQLNDEPGETISPKQIRDLLLETQNTPTSDLSDPLRPN